MVLEGAVAKEGVVDEVAIPCTVVLGNGSTGVGKGGEAGAKLADDGRRGVGEAEVAYGGDDGACKESSDCRGAIAIKSNQGK